MLPNMNLTSFLLDPSARSDLAEPVLLGLAGSWIALLFHEAGHALAALLLGVRIWGIRLGAIAAGSLPASP